MLLAPLQTYAIENGGVGGRPANPRADNPRTKSIFIYQLKPGEQANDGVLVSNNTDTQQTVSIYPVDAVLSSGGAFACKQAVEPKEGVGSWITLQSASITLDPNTTQTVPFTVSVPQNAGAGEHDGCIALQAESQAGKASGTNGVVLSFRSAIRVAVTVPGKIVKKLSITSVKTTAKDDMYVVAPAVRNDGNVSLDATTRIELVSLFGPTVSTTKEGSSPVLPRSSESWQYEVKRPFWGGPYRARVVVSYNGDPSSQLGVDSHTPATTLTRSSALFFAAPAPLAAVIELAVLLLIVLLIVWLVRRRLQARHVSRHWEEYTVKKSDTLQGVAASRNVSWRQIAKANKLKAPYHLEKGQKLTLPPAKE